MSAATSTPATDRERTSFIASLLRRASAARRRADLRPGPPPAFRGRATSSARRRSCSRSWARRATRRRHHLRRSAGRPPSPTSRSAARCSATRTSIAAIEVDDLHAWRTDQYRAGSLILVAAGKVDHDAAGRARRGARSAACPTARSRRPSRRASPAARRAERPQGRPGPSRLRLCRARPSSMPDYYAARLFADVVGGGASSRLFQAVREEQGLAYSVSAGAAALSRLRPVLVLCCDRAPRGGRCGAADGRGVARRDRRRPRPSASSTGPARQAKAGLLMSLESSWGQASYVARQLAPHGRLVEPAEVVARARGGDPGPGPRGRRARCSPGRGRARRSACRPSARREARHP